MILTKSDFYRILVETNLLSTYTITYVMANDIRGAYGIARTHGLCRRGPMDLLE